MSKHATTPTVAEPNPFDDWVPRDYLREYYRDLPPDEVQAIRFFVDALREEPKGRVLCFGCGPTLHHVFLAAPHMTEIHLADYLPRNLEEIAAWQQQAPGAHDWTPFVRYTLLCETGAEPTGDEIAAREASLRRGIAGLLHGDAGLADPIGETFRGRFDVVLSPFCADSATGDRAVWTRYCRNIASLVRPGGLFLTAALRRSRGYKVGPRFFPSANIDEVDLRAVLAEDFRPDTIEIEVCEVPEHRGQGYAGILLARARKEEAPLP
jgi:NNMT/PNMT/TEMT family